MKYKILTDGKDFKVKVKHGLLWTFLKSYFHTGCFECPSGSYPKRFKTEKEAVKYIKEEYGKSAERVREYRVV